MSEYHDPREELTEPVDIGNVYKDTRSDEEIVVVYEDNRVVLSKGEESYRLDQRKAFERNAGAGRYSLQGEQSVSRSAALDDLQQAADRLREKDGYKPKHKADGIEMAIRHLDNDLEDMETIAFEEISGVGEKTAQALRGSGYTTREDIRHASDDALLDVTGVGQANLENIKNA